MDWDSEDHLSDVRTRVALLQKGCGCKDASIIAASIRKTIVIVVLDVNVKAVLIYLPQTLVNHHRLVKYQPLLK